jgi:hypothetical protein
MVDLKTLSERIIRSNKPGLGGQIAPDRPVILNRIRRSFSGGWNGHFEPDRSKINIFLLVMSKLKFRTRILIIRKRLWPLFTIFIFVKTGKTKELAK